MTNHEHNVITELEDMLDDATEENNALRRELENAKSDLIVTLEKLVGYQEKYIAELNDKLSFYDDSDEDCDCSMCH